MRFERSRRLLFLGVAVSAAAWVSATCSSDPGAPTPVPTTVTITPSTVSFTALAQTQALTATVLDQNGAMMNPQPAVAWSTTNAAIVTVTPAGVAAAAGAGNASVRATASSAVGTVPVTVNQTATQFTKDLGDGQSGVVAQQLTSPLVVQVKDAGGFAIPNAIVAFGVTQGGGGLTATLDTTGTDGRASTRWTLGTSVTSGQQVSATTGALTPLTFTATAFAGPSDTVAVQAGDLQTAGAGAQVPIDPAVVVRDAFGNVKAAVTVAFAVTGGNGLVSKAQDTTDASGVASVTWTLGNAGANSLQATASGVGIGGNPITFTATANAPGAPASIAIHEGDNQTTVQGLAVNVPPAAIVRDASNGPVGGVEVVFAVASGGGSVTGATDTTDLFGIARVGSWTLGAVAGPNSLTATATGGGITGNPVTFNATGTAQGSYNIVVRTLTTLTAPQQEAFDSAEAKWERLIVGDVPNITVILNAGQCGAGSPAINELVDDVLILASVVPIDGPGGILGQAGPCAIRAAGFQPAAGVMRFDSADVAGLLTQGLFDEVILHEMGHILGVGTIWGPSRLDLLREPSLSGGADPHFIGARAIAAFDAVGGTGYTASQKVPVENTGGPGTADAHWRESVFDNELMTGFLNLGVNPLSAVTVASQWDEAYVVNLAGSDAYTLPTVLSAARAGPLIPLGDDIWRGPIAVIDARGRVIRVIRQ